MTAADDPTPTRSLWLDRAGDGNAAVRRAFAPGTFGARGFTPGAHHDCVVVGGGLTGLTTALLCARAGQDVLLVEARALGAVTTGNTTAKISLLQGAKFSEIRRRHSRDLARRYLDANREGQQWLLRYCAEQGISVQHRPGYSYAGTPSGTDRARGEWEAARDAGLDVSWIEETELPFPVHGAVALDGQAQFDPMDAVETLAADVVGRGGTIAEGVRAHGASIGRGRVRLDTSVGQVTADRVVLATGTPILDRGGFFARLEPMRSYSAAFTVPGAVTQGMYLSVDEPTRSLRSVPRPDGDLLLVGGNGHPVGRSPSPQRAVDDLVEWTEEHFPGARLTHRWSAQDYQPADALPYVGPLLPGDERILVATGFAKWGMTNAVAAALALSSRMFGGQMPWADVFATWHPRQVAGLPAAAAINGGVALHMARGWLGVAPPLPSRDAPPEGCGRVEHGWPSPRAVCTVDGRTHRVSAICPHLYGILRWNDAEKSWDCPLHGSRFAADGTLLEGPATRGVS